MTPEEFFYEVLNLEDPEVRKVWLDVLEDEQNRQSLANKIGVFLGHFCEDAAAVDLRKQGYNVIKHPNGQKESPDLQICHEGEIYWIEHKNCSAGSYAKIVEDAVPLRNYKHSYRNAAESNSTANLYYEDQSDDEKTCLLAVCTYPLTKKFTWSYSTYEDLPEHPKHKGKKKSALRIPIEPGSDDTWTTDLRDILERK